MAAPGQRIRSATPDPERHTHARVADTAGMDVFREHDACGVGFVAQSSGARSH